MGGRRHEPSKPPRACPTLINNVSRTEVITGFYWFSLGDSYSTFHYRYRYIEITTDLRSDIFNMQEERELDHYFCDNADDE